MIGRQPGAALLSSSIQAWMQSSRNFDLRNRSSACVHRKLRAAASSVCLVFRARALRRQVQSSPVRPENLYEAGIRDFDVASIDEVSLIDGLFGKVAGMYFNNPAKSRAAIRSASNDYGIRFYTIDHASELEKILDEAQLDDDLVVAVRLATGSRDARYALSTKFGASRRARP